MTDPIGDAIIKLAQAIEGLDNSTSLLERADHAHNAIIALAKLAMDQHQEKTRLARRLARIESELSSGRRSDSVTM